MTCTLTESLEVPRTKQNCTILRPQTEIPYCPHFPFQHTSPYSPPVTLSFAVRTNIGRGNHMIILASCKHFGLADIQGEAGQKQNTKQRVANLKHCHLHYPGDFTPYFYYIGYLMTLSLSRLYSIRW
jgi:hypothetical protein